MLCKAFSFLSLILLGDVVNCVYVSFATDNEVLYQQEKLPFTCSPTGAALTGTITAITLWKNSTSGWKEIVKIWLQIENGQAVNRITWTNTDIENRATIINQKVSPSSEAGLQIEIGRFKVQCSDKGVYKCSISGNDIGSIKLDSESALKTVGMKVEPASINPIQVQPQQLDNTYNPYTSVRLTCIGDVGNPASNLRWCIRTTRSNMMDDFTVYSNTEDITRDTPILSGCQYRQQSVLRYNVSTTIQQADFRCETGGTSTTCGHSSAIAANYTVYRYTDANTDGQSEPDTSNAGVIAGAVIGSFVGIVLIIIIIYFVAFRKKNTGETYRTKEENGTGNTPIDNTIYNLPHKERDRNDRNSSRDRSRHYENKGMDEPHTRGYLPDMDPRGRSNRGMDRSFDDVRDNNVMSSRGPIMGSNASFGSAV